MKTRVRLKQDRVGEETFQLGKHLGRTLLTLVLECFNSEFLRDGEGSI
jgi:hypothetical protein